MSCGWEGLKGFDLFIKVDEEISFKAKIQRSIHALVSKVREALTLPELVRQYFFDTLLVTTWILDTSIYFREKWKGTMDEYKSTVRKYESNTILIYRRKNSIPPNIGQGSRRNEKSGYQ